MQARSPNKWLVTMLIGLILGPLTGLVMFVGIFSDSNSGGWSTVFLVSGWSSAILFWTGLIGFFAPKSKRVD